jgi:hypothetical protein
VMGFFWDRVSQTVWPGWLQTAILLISASWVERIIGVSHQRLPGWKFLMRDEMGTWKTRSEMERSQRWSILLVYLRNGKYIVRTIVNKEEVVAVGYLFRKWSIGIFSGFRI